jgi:hypothetical protein
MERESSFNTDPILGSTTNLINDAHDLLAPAEGSENRTQHEAGNFLIELFGSNSAIMKEAPGGITQVIVRETSDLLEEYEDSDNEVTETSPESKSRGYDDSELQLVICAIILNHKWNILDFEKKKSTMRSWLSSKQQPTETPSLHQRMTESLHLSRQLQALNSPVKCQELLK